MTFLSIFQVVDAYLMKNSRSDHYLPAGLLMAKEVLDSARLRRLQHVVLRRATNLAGVALDHFDLPADYLDSVTIGVRNGDYWSPLETDPQLMGFVPRFSVWGPQFGGAFVNGAISSWFNAPTTGVSNWPTRNLTTYNIGGVRVLPQDGHIIAPHGAVGDELYLVYVGTGPISTATQIPADAAPVIEAYMDWRFAANRRGGKASAEAATCKAGYEAALRAYNRQRRREDGKDLTLGRLMNALGRGYY